MSGTENDETTFDDQPASLTGSAGALGPRMAVSDDIEKRSAGALAERPEPPEPPKPPQLPEDSAATEESANDNG